MNFTELATIRQSCRKYNPEKDVEETKLQEILETANLSPSACNSQPYKITVVRENAAKEVAKATTGAGINTFTSDVPLMLVISEDSYSKTAALGAKLKNNDYRSIDIGIVSAFITLKATELGLGTCILGWFDDKKIRNICSLNSPVRLVIALGYAADDYPLREKKRKALTDYVCSVE